MERFFLGAGYGHDRLKTIRNPVQPWSPKRIEVEENDEFLFVGRLDEEKGIEDLIAATNRAGVKLCVIGDGALKAKVTALGGDVRMLGWLSPPEIGLVVQRAKALLMPSRYPEPFGLVAIEAARSGIPVIMAKDAFLAEEMESNGMGYSCDTADEQVFAEVLVKFAKISKEDIQKMSKRAFDLSPRLANTNQAWHDALLAEYGLLISSDLSQSVVQQQTGGNAQ